MHNKRMPVLRVSFYVFEVWLNEVLFAYFIEKTKINEIQKCTLFL